MASTSAALTETGELSVVEKQAGCQITAALGIRAAVRLFKALVDEAHTPAP